jgi:hypothetical protein
VERSDLIKLIGSAAQSGLKSIKIHITHKREIFIISLKENKCPNLIFRACAFLLPLNLLLPVLCNNKRCTAAISKIKKGKIK